MRTGTLSIGLVYHETKTQGIFSNTRISELIVPHPITYEKLRDKYVFLYNNRERLSNIVLRGVTRAQNEMHQAITAIVTDARKGELYINMQKIIVSGSDGFIGSHLTEELIKRGYGDMVIMSMQTYEERLAMADIYAKFAEADEDVRSGKISDAANSTDNIYYFIRSLTTYTPIGIIAAENFSKRKDGCGDDRKIYRTAGKNS